MNRKLDQIVGSLNGNGHPGLKTRIDRVEQAVLAVKKLAWMAIGCAFTVLTVVVVNIINGGPQGG